MSVCFALAAATLAPACQRRRAPPEVSTAAAPPVAWPRYWLRDATLLDRPGGSETRHVGGPVLVERGPDGRVRTTPEALDRFEGYLPEAPDGRRARGLMLYAQRVSDLRLGSPGGPVIGRLHPGAFVSVLGEQDGWAAVGIRGFAFNGTEPLVAHVERGALGAQERPPKAPAHEGKGRAAIGLPVDFWFDDPSVGRSVAVAALPCHPLWLPEQGWSSQYVSGVELRGDIEYDLRPFGAVTYQSLRCPAHAVARSGNDLLWTRVGDEGRAETSKVRSTPEGFAPLRTDPADPLASMIEGARPLFWLIDRESGVACDEWAWASARKRVGPDGRVTSLRARLTRRAPVASERGPARAWYPAEYRPADGRSPGRLELEPLRYDEGPAPIRCRCSFDYTLAEGDDRELQMLGRPLPLNAVAFAPVEAERWFASREACEAARRETLESIERDGAYAVRAGFHPMEGPWLY